MHMMFTWICQKSIDFASTFFNQNSVIQRVRKSILYCKLQVIVTLLEANNQNARAVSHPPGSTWYLDFLKNGWKINRSWLQWFLGNQKWKMELSMAMVPQWLDDFSWKMSEANPPDHDVKVWIWKKKPQHFVWNMRTKSRGCHLMVICATLWWLYIYIMATTYIL